MSMKVKDWAEGLGVGEEMEIVGADLTSLTRTKLPSEGDMEGKVMERLTVGVKVSGMILEGRRFAVLSDVIRLSVAMVANRCASAVLTK
jgi:hypothetical protein